MPSRHTGALYVTRRTASQSSKARACQLPRKSGISQENIQVTRTSCFRVQGNPFSFRCWSVRVTHHKMESRRSKQREPRDRLWSRGMLFRTIEALAVFGVLCCHQRSVSTRFHVGSTVFLSKEVILCCATNTFVLVVARACQRAFRGNLRCSDTVSSWKRWRYECCVGFWILSPSELPLGFREP